MDNKYFEDLVNSINEPTENKKNDTNPTATLTVKVDIDAKIYCDGDFLDLVEANVVKKMLIETGQHLITIESENVEGVAEDREVDIKEAGKNYLILVNGMKQKKESVQEQEKIRLETEPYAVLSDNNHTLTFYYDHLKKQRRGMDLGLIITDYRDYIYNRMVDAVPKWTKHSEEITTVIFDDSFSRCRCINSTENWFWNMSNLTSIIGLHNLDTGNVTRMHDMFSGCKSLKELDLSHFDTGKVTDIRCMFRSCKSMQKLDLSHFDTGNVTDMSGVFLFCESLQDLDLSHFDTGKVTSIHGMFKYCESLQELDLSHFDTGKVTDMAFLFSGCESLQELDLSHFDTGNVTSMHSMFSGCKSLKELDLSHFDTGKVTDMAFLFSGCESLQDLDIRGFKMDAIVDHMFWGGDYFMFKGVNDSIIRR